MSVALSNASTTDANGFFQHTFGGNTSPGCILVTAILTLVCDSFITLGEACDSGTDASARDPDFDSTAFNTSGEVTGGWFNSSPTNGQGVPDANGRVLVARLSNKQNKNSTGDVCIFAQLVGSDEVTDFLL